MYDQTPNSDQINEKLCRAIFSAASASPEQMEAAAEAPFLYQRIRNEVAAIKEAEARRAKMERPLWPVFGLIFRWTASALALFLLACGLWQLARRPAQKISSGSPQNIAFSTPAQAPEPTKSMNHTTPENPPVIKKSFRSSRIRKSIPIRAPSKESTTAFMPLTYTTESALAGGQLIRIEVTGSSLASLGFVVSPERSQERIKADVILGDDGVARAIRIVQ